MYQNLYTLSIYLASKMYQGLSNFSTMLPGVFVNVRYKCGYVHLFPHMTALHTVSYARHFTNIFKFSSKGYKSPLNWQI